MGTREHSLSEWILWYINYISVYLKMQTSWGKGPSGRMHMDFPKKTAMCTEEPRMKEV